MTERTSTRTYHECDVCFKEIQNWRPGGMALWDDISDYQFLYSKSGEQIEVCSDCCLRLHTLERLGIVNIDWKRLLQPLGFRETEQGWLLERDGGTLIISDPRILSDG